MTHSSAFCPLLINNPSQIHLIANSLNHQSKLFSTLAATSFTSTGTYIKWFSPSLDYPCLPNAYYLYAPFKVVWKNQSGLMTPYFISAHEQGERGDVIEVVKDSIIGIVVRLPVVFSGY